VNANLRLQINGDGFKAKAGSWAAGHSGAAWQQASRGEGIDRPAIGAVFHAGCQ